MYANCLVARLEYDIYIKIRIRASIEIFVYHVGIIQFDSDLNSLRIFSHIFINRVSSFEDCNIIRRSNIRNAARKLEIQTSPQDVQTNSLICLLIDKINKFVDDFKFQK
jgi:hypothetical protein